MAQSDKNRLRLSFFPLSSLVMKHAIPDPPTQKQLIEVGMSQSFASQILAGKKTPSMRMAHKIERATGFPVHGWLTLHPNRDAAA